MVDLAVVMVGGVQCFIEESRSTADVAGASDVLQELVRAAADAVEAGGFGERVHLDHPRTA